MTKYGRTVLLLLPLFSLSCSEPGNEVLSIDATGTLAGVVFLDRDGNLTAQPAVDVPIQLLDIAIVTRAGAVVATTRTDSAGRFRADDLPAGTYRLIPDSTTFGDTVRVVHPDNAEATVVARDTTAIAIAVGYPTLSIRATRARVPGSRVALNAVALNSWATFGDSTVHLADSSGVLRAIGVRQAVVLAGDSVRVIATVARQNERVVLQNVLVVSARRGALPAPTELTTAAAAAAGNTLDGQHIRVRNAVVTDGSSLVGGDLLLTINDGSGPLQLLIDASANINPPLPIAIGAELDISGLLVPNQNGPQLQLKPRTTADVTVRYRTISIAAARTRPTGQYAVINGVALNDLGVFGDLGVHVADSSSAIRVRSAQAGFVSTGDSVSVVGQISRLDSQPALINATVSVIRRSNAPLPQSMSTQSAAAANGGLADAALVKLSDVLVTDTATVAAELHLFVNDGTGVVEVVIDRDAVINPPHIGKDSRWDITGLLVHSNAPGVWWLKPRSRADLVAR